MDRPKRPSGRTGRRRLTLAETMLRGPKAVAERQRRLGKGLTGADLAPGGLDEPPAWADAAVGAIWRQIVVDAPPGLLRATDGPVVACLAEAIARHAAAVVALREAATATRDEAMLGPRRRVVREAARDIAMLSSVLCLPPGLRSRLTLPQPDDRYAGFVLIEGGRST